MNRKILKKKCNQIIQKAKSFCVKSIPLVKSEYSFIKKDFNDYIKYFGKLSDIIITPYFHVAVIISFLVIFFGQDAKIWTETALNTLPDILGFSIGGYAIIITFGDEKFRKFLVDTEIDNQKSLLLVVNGTFIHFILCQTIAIILAYICSSFDIENYTINFIFSIPFSYSILFCIAIAFEIKTISSWYRKFLKNKDKPTYISCKYKSRRIFPRRTNKKI